MSAGTFQATADASGGCVLPFDEGSPTRLRKLLEALAVLVAGGLRLLQERRKALSGARLLLEHPGEGLNREPRGDGLGVLLSISADE